MKKGLFTISFMLILTITFIAVLAYVNESTLAIIQKNQEIEKYRSILYAFDIFPTGTDEKQFSPTSITTDIKWANQNQILENFQQKIIKRPLFIPTQLRNLATTISTSLQDSVDVYIRIDENGQASAFGFILTGKGLWGTLEAFGAISADIKSLVGIDFTSQVETPGLGARITETEFKYFFRQLSLEGFNKPESPRPALTMISKKSATNIQNPTNSLQAITGATQTCNGVLDMLNSDLKFYIALIKANEDFLRSERFLNQTIFN
jgi:Na+-transporting NADH:ubiquinone oxidoreductase subunit C